MVNYGFFLLPLYLYPSPNTWNRLFNAAKNNWKAVLNTINTYPNIKTLGYVHTANAYNCGTSHTDICTCTAPLAQVKANITSYQNWGSSACSGSSGQDFHISGIFVDESPSNSTCVDYMRTVTNFAKATLTKGSTVLFNSGVAVDAAYWSIADYINVFENTEAAYDSADIGLLDGGGDYSEQATLIVHSYTHGKTKVLKRDVNTILNWDNDDIAGLYITDASYAAFPSFWDAFVGNVSQVVKSNKGQ